MANLVAAQPILAELDHVVEVTIWEFSCKGDRAVTLRVGAQGPIGMSVGVEHPTFSFKLFTPSTGLSTDWVALMKKPDGFTLSFSLGAERHQFFGCRVQSRAIASNPDSGEVTFSVDGAATEWIRTA